MFARDELATAPFEAQRPSDLFDRIKYAFQRVGRKTDNARTRYRSAATLNIARSYRADLAMALGKDEIRFEFAHPGDVDVVERLTGTQTPSYFAIDVPAGYGDVESWLAQSRKRTDPCRVVTLM
jgi:hypothetical protein